MDEKNWEDGDDAARMSEEDWEDEAERDLIQDLETQLDREAEIERENNIRRITASDDKNPPERPLDLENLEDLRPSAFGPNHLQKAKLLYSDCLSIYTNLTFLVDDLTRRLAKAQKHLLPLKGRVLLADELVLPQARRLHQQVQEIQFYLPTLFTEIREQRKVIRRIENDIEDRWNGES